MNIADIEWGPHQAGAHMSEVWEQSTNLPFKVYRALTRLPTAGYGPEGAYPGWIYITDEGDKHGKGRAYEPLVAQCIINELLANLPQKVTDER